MSNRPPKKAILLIRLSAIGDIVMASGLPAAIKYAYPNCKVYWVVETPYTDLVEGHPAVDGVIGWPKNEWRQLYKAGNLLGLYRSIKAFQQQLQTYHFDIAIDAQGLLKSAFIAKLSGASKRLGFAGKEGGRLLLTDIVHKELNQQISSEYKGLAQAMGSSSYQLSLPVTDSAKNSVMNHLEQGRLAGPMVICCPFTTRPQKHWPTHYWRELFELLLHNHYQPVIIGGQNDKHNAEQMAAEVMGVMSLAGQLDLQQSTALIHQASGLVGVDTGMTHIGTVFQIPTVAIFGSTRPYTQTDSQLTEVLYEPLACAPCKRKPTCNGRFDCMQAISPQAVMTTLTSLISRADAHG